MIIATLQAAGTLRPELSLHGDIVKIDLGALLLEMDKESFLNLIANIITQATNHGVYEQLLR